MILSRVARAFLLADFRLHIIIIIWNMRRPKDFVRGDTTTTSRLCGLHRAFFPADYMLPIILTTGSRSNHAREKKYDVRIHDFRL